MTGGHLVCHVSFIFISVVVARCPAALCVVAGHVLAITCHHVPATAPSHSHPSYSSSSSSSSRQTIQQRRSAVPAARHHEDSLCHDVKLTQIALCTSLAEFHCCECCRIYSRTDYPLNITTLATLYEACVCGQNEANLTSDMNTSRPV